MSDELKNKNGKVKVMYGRSDDDSDVVALSHYFIKKTLTIVPIG